MSEVLEYMAPLKGTHIYDAMERGHLEKTERIDAGYGRWLQELLEHITDTYNLGDHPRILDVGCGTGELVVRMNVLGFDATGVDLHERHLVLARILAEENDLPNTLFVSNNGNDLPFENNSFDIVTLFSVVEHLSDTTLSQLLPELKRICCGILYVLVPNRLKLTDDHTGLRFVPWMPRWLATLYVKSRGPKYQYYISESATWDVYHRSYGRVVSLFQNYGFTVRFPPDNIVYPPLDQVPPIRRIGKNLRFRNKNIYIGAPLPHRLMTRFRYPKQGFYPYLNLIFVSEKSGSTHC